ncbi:hypothetical protein [Brevibacterium zhoupengii]|nr:hypothetical protein [Brevibacterium zhoupengii]
MHRQVVQTEHWRLCIIPMTAPSLADAVMGGTVSVDSAGGVTVHTGAMYGPVEVTIEHLDHAPENSAEDWEDVVELSALATEDEPVTLVGMFSESSALSAYGSGAPALEKGEFYRIRIHLCGRDDSDTDELIERDHGAKDHLLLQLWPAATSEPEIIKMTSSKAHDDNENSEWLTRSRSVVIGTGEPDIEALKAQNLCSDR